MNCVSDYVWRTPPGSHSDKYVGEFTATINREMVKASVRVFCFLSLAKPHVEGCTDRRYSSNNISCHKCRLVTSDYTNYINKQSHRYRKSSVRLMSAENSCGLYLDIMLT